MKWLQIIEHSSAFAATAIMVISLVLNIVSAFVSNKRAKQIIRSLPPAVLTESVVLNIVDKLLVEYKEYVGNTSDIETAEKANSVETGK
jgi:hypothetical protein